MKRKLALLGTLLGSNLFALDINDKLSLDVTITGVFQYADFSKNATGDIGAGSVATDIGLNFHPTENDEVQLTVSFAGGEGLKKYYDEKGFSLMPNADDLEEDLKDINGRGRDYLLEAWYKHTFKFGKDWYIAPTIGIIDGCAYIDDNDVANDEITQFMNDAFVNNPIAEIPSYDLGAVVEAGNNLFNVRGLVINTKNDEGNDYNYYAVQFGISPDIELLKDGNYRIYYYRTTKDFENKNGEEDYKEGIGLSLDKSFGNLSGFIRTGWNTHTDTGDFKSFYSGGFSIKGNWWKRPEDNVAIAYGYLDGNTDEINNVQVAEAYYKFHINQYADLTFDVQYQTEDYKKEEDKRVTAYGVRLNVAF